MDRIYSVQSQLNLQAVGFSFLYHHMKQFPKFYDYLEDNNIKVIHLTRHNMLDVILSLKLVRAHGDIWGGFIYTKPVKLSYKYLLRRFAGLEKSIENARQMIKEKGVDFIETHYDELKKKETHRKLMDFIEVDQFELVPNTMKQRIKSQSEMIINYNELKNKFRTTKYYKYFED